jgi:hypothetical protein
MTQMTKQCIAEGTVEDQRVPARCNQLSDRSIVQHAHAYDMIYVFLFQLDSAKNELHTMLNIEFADMLANKASGCVVVRNSDGTGFSLGDGCTQDIRNSYENIIDKAYQDIEEVEEKVEKKDKR